MFKIALYYFFFIWLIYLRFYLRDVALLNALDARNKRLSFQYFLQKLFKSTIIIVAPNNQLNFLYFLKFKIKATCV